MVFKRRKLLQWAVGSLAYGLLGSAFGQSAEWVAIETAAKGQTVYFNAWGGSERVNAYLQWVGQQTQARYGITLQHVKLTDTVEAVKRVRGEKDAGKLKGGSIDMMWINGENFLAMKREGLLFGPFAESLPNFVYVDTKNKPTTQLDFAEPTEGLEAPWGMAQFTFFVDGKKVAKPPETMAELAAFARENPGRVTYPRPPAFIGTTFLKQALAELTVDRTALYKPMTPQAFDALTPALWKYLDALHPYLWRNGKQFPATPAALKQMFADGELAVGMAFNPNEAANEIAAKRFPDSVRSFQMRDGTIGNTHFLAIPFNANASPAARVVINFMLSPEAQARKADIAIWGDPTVVTTEKMSAEDRARFQIKHAPGQLSKTQAVIPEPHGSWVDPIEREWAKRYGS
jgi:putative thiamine transport system substrate-binding protein